MGLWPPVSIVFFIYVALLVLLLPNLNRRRRLQALAGTAVGLLLTITSQVAPNRVANDWALPPAVLLVAYWTSGLLYRAPMPRVERLLLRIDERLRIRSAAAAMPREIAELLEVAYFAVYPVIPAALVIHVMTSETPDPQRFWTVILVTDFICFGTLPWVQTRPPRALEGEPPWTSRFRAVNLRLLGKTSIQVNTFPSGHAAEALAAFLLVLDAPAPLVTMMLFSAVAISAGTVFGRYHFLADVVAGWAVAFVVWLALWG
jgi:membrane-associated phospholipid phosphatase